MSDVELGKGVPVTRFGKYELFEKIGSGGMAEIYRARLTSIGGFEKPVVVKRILPSFAANKAFVRMLIAEAKLSSALHHANIVQIYELGEWEGQPFIAMEYVHGKDLLQTLGRSTKLKRRIPIELALFVAAEVCQGLDYAHHATDARGKPMHLIHRDVSPSNIIISYDGLVKITDFGVARASLERKQQTRSGVLKGKLGYMSPEQVLGAEFDHRADIFSAGIILYETLTLKRLFLGKTDLETLINIRDAKIEPKLQKHSYIPEPVQAILRKALAREPAERYQTALQFRDDIHDVLFELRARADGARLGVFLRELFADGQERSGIWETRGAEESESGFRVVTGPGAREESSVDAGAPDALGNASTHEFESTVEEVGGNPMQATSVERRAAPRARLRISGGGEMPPSADPDEIEHDVEEPRGGRLRSAAFRLRNHEGHEFGPITYSNFINLLKTRSISEDEQVSVDGGDWQPVRDMSALHDLLPTFFEKLHNKPRYEGAVNQLTLPRLVFQLATARETGVLKLTRGSTVKEIYFKVGRPRHIASSMKQELFGNYLVEQNALTPGQLQQAIEKARAMGTRLGEALLALRFVEPYDLYRLLSAQFRSKFREIFSWKHGWHQFHVGVAPEGDVVPLEVEPISVMAEGVRDFYSVETLEVFFKDHFDRPYVLARNGAVPVDDFKFSARESRMYSYMGGSRTLRDVMRQHGRTPEGRLTLLRIAFLLYHTELLSFEG
jgi:serine/threonine protein kinase